VILTFDEELGRKLEPAFLASGWGRQRHVFMAHHREPTKEVDPSTVSEVDEAALRPGRTIAICSYPWGSPELARELLDAKVLLGDRAETRFFGVEVNGEIVAWSDLYLAQGMAQVEDVATLEEHRGHGYASAIVLRAVREAQAAGADLIFLVADDEDWPKELYERLGFDIVGRSYKFIRP
jgi:ribosomal protein S18 acetylase RimI-like enzyme